MQSLRKLLWRIQISLESRAKEKAGAWVSSRVEAEDWKALVEALLPNPGEVASAVKRQYIETQQYRADNALSVAAKRDSDPDNAAKAGRAILTAYDKEPSNPRLAKLAIYLGKGAVLPQPAPVMAVVEEAASRVKRYYDAGLYNSTQPFGLESFLRDVHDLDPKRAKQEACVHRWRKADVSSEPFDICDECGLLWQYTDFRGDDIPDARSRRPKMGFASG